MTNGEHCGNCKFFLLNPQDVRHGFCRKTPPAIFPIGTGPAGMQQLQFVSQWPPVQESQWCGEWKLKLAMAS